MEATIQTSCKRADGTRDCFATFQTDAKVSELPWQKAGLTWTASGYGMRIPTRYMVRLHGKWRRSSAWLPPQNQMILAALRALPTL